MRLVALMETRLGAPSLAGLFARPSRGHWRAHRRTTPTGRLERLRLPTRDFVALLRQLEMLVRAGITPDAALRQLGADAPKGPAKLMLERIATDVQSGRPIHEACRYFKRQFPAHLAVIVASGETSARLPEALSALARHLSEMDDLRRTARRALVYPIIVLVAVVALTGFLLGYVVPQFAEVFSSLGVTLPRSTVLLLNASALVRANGLYGAAGAMALGCGYWTLSKRGKFWRDAALLRVPIWGGIIRHLATARIAAHVGLLQAARIPLLEALRTGAEVVDHAVFSRQLQRTRAEVAAGRSLADSLPAVFPAVAIPIIRAGEVSGQLSTALQHVEDYAAKEAKEKLQLALTLLEPALIAGLTGILAFVALSFFLPFAQLLGGVGTH